MTLFKKRRKIRQKSVDELPQKQEKARCATILTFLKMLGALTNILSFFKD
ncbi:MAG TPA: hypothetical protein PLQ57_06865 [Saprospiraceae bacterium]|nr:hypothetical protein [Saprospiraceae bacterium]